MVRQVGRLNGIKFFGQPLHCVSVYGEQTSYGEDLLGEVRPGNNMTWIWNAAYFVFGKRSYQDLRWAPFAEQRWTGTGLWDTGFRFRIRGQS